MSDVTEADREKAELISTAWEASGQGYGDLDDLIAAALAEEREKARQEGFNDGVLAGMKTAMENGR